jgi:hypothetical protein
MLCIARDYAGHALQREVVAVSGRVAYIVKPSGLEARDDQDEAGVAFPLTDLFAPDDSLLDNLKRAELAADSTATARLWSEARPLPI